MQGFFFCDFIFFSVLYYRWKAKGMDMEKRSAGRSGRMGQSNVFVNGKIFTSNPEQAVASAMAIRDGRIEWIGDDVEAFSIEGTRIDLLGRRVLPGFIDAHLHPLFLANIARQAACTAPRVHSIADMIDELKKRQEAQTPGEWIEGWGYDEGKLAERRTPNRSDLDRVSTDSPIVVTRTCGHTVSVNSKALELAGIDKEAVDPAGGKIDRDAGGEPTGILRESARFLVLDLLPKQTMDEQAQLIAGLTDELFSYGITGITDLMALTRPVDYVELYKLARRKGLKQRTALYTIWPDAKTGDVLTNETTDSAQPVFISGIKLFADGSVSGRTAWVDPAYNGTDDEYGISTMETDELLEAGEAAKQHGVQVAVHAMGEQAISQVVDAFHGQQAWLEDAPSIRIEHAAMPTADAIRKSADANIAFVPQPVFLFAEIESYLHNLGAERTKSTYPIQKMIGAGIPVAFSSDAPVNGWTEPLNPFVGIQAAVTRIAYDGTDTGQDERIGVEKAIELYTKNAQEITRIKDVGQLRTGFHADFLVMEEDILEMDELEIGKARVLETYMAGERVYCR